MPARTAQRVVQGMVVVAAIGVGWLAVQTLMHDGRYAPYLAIANLHERREPLAAQAITAYAARLEPPPPVCRSDILDAMLLVLRLDLDQARQRQDSAGWHAALQRSEAFLRHALACRPTDGLTWADFAAARWRLGGSAAEQAALLTLSQAYDPSQINTIAARFRQWKIVSPTVIAMADGALRDDLRSLVFYAEPASAARILAGLPAALEPLLAQESSLLPPERRQSLRDAGLSADP